MLNPAKENENAEDRRKNKDPQDAWLLLLREGIERLRDADEEPGSPRLQKAEGRHRALQAKRRRLLVLCDQRRRRGLCTEEEQRATLEVANHGYRLLRCWRQ